MGFCVIDGTVDQLLKTEVAASRVATNKLSAVNKQRLETFPTNIWVNMFQLYFAPQELEFVGLVIAIPSKSPRVEFLYRWLHEASINLGRMHENKAD